MSMKRALAALAAVALLLAGCDGDDAGTPTADSTTTSASEADGDATTTTAVAGLGQPAVWPAADVVFATPEEAAEDFVTTVLGVPPSLGEFRRGDSRSGEIEVFSPDDDGEGERVVRGVLLLRQLGPDDGWFVIGVANENATIETPETGDEVPAGTVRVEGVARGFEATVVVSAFVAGDADAQLDEEITVGGAFEEPEPYTATLDLSGASPGDVVTLLVRGGTGHEDDPGDFGAIPVVIAG